MQFYPLPRPIRLLETRPGETGCFKNNDQPLATNGTITQPARVTCDGLTIPSNAQAVVGNATVVNFISPGFSFITLWPTGASQPTVSNLNFMANQIIPNSFAVRLGTGGAFNLFASGATHFIVDLSGFFAAGGTNQAPAVDAGADQTVAQSGTANLIGFVTDDGLPSGGSLASTWNKVSGPGNVTFANANQKVTTASFSAAGAYVLRLTASDSALSASDDVTITANPPLAVNAGADQVITLPSGAMLAGSVTGGSPPIAISCNHRKRRPSPTSPGGGRLRRDPSPLRGWMNNWIRFR